MNDARPLNSDRLGAKGEARFPELCLDALLEPAKPDRDRLGWDSVVTWPLVTDMLLDQRPPPLVCHVQLKTIWSGNDTISLNLGTLYNIVSDSRPAYIVIFEVDDPSLAFVGMRLIHITGDFLGEILKRLRAAQSEGKATGDVIFQASIAKWSVALADVSGAAFRRAVEADVPHGMDAYGTAKQALLATLGYEKGHMSLHTVIEAATLDDVVEGFLGVRPLRLVDAEHFDNRFEIPVSLGKWDTSNATIEIQPTRFDRGIVTIKRARDGRALTFYGDIFTAPHAVLGPDRMVIEFRNALFRLRADFRTVSGNTTSTINLTITDDLGAIVETAAVWRDFYTLLAWMVSEPMAFELRTRKVKTPPISGTAEPRISPADAKRMERYARGADVVDWAMVRAEAPGTRLRVKELFDAADDLEIIKGIEQTPGEITPLGFTTAYAEVLPENFEYDMLYINQVAIGAFQIAYAARTKMKSVRTGEAMHWSSGPLQLAYVRKIKNGRLALSQFLLKARRITGISSWVAPSVAEFGVSPPLTVVDGETGQIAT